MWKRVVVAWGLAWVGGCDEEGASGASEGTGTTSASTDHDGSSGPAATTETPADGSETGGTTVAVDDRTTDGTATRGGTSAETSEDASRGGSSSESSSGSSSESSSESSSGSGSAASSDETTDATTDDATAGTTAGTTDDPTDGTTTGDPEPSGCAANCVVGCEQPLLAPLQGQTALWHTADARLALDGAGRAALWGPGDDALVAVFPAVDDAALETNLLGLRSGGTLSLVNPTTTATLGSVDGVGATWGLARDGSYAWVADTDSLRVYEPDGTLRFSLDGDFGGAEVLALAAEVSVVASATGNEVWHVDAVSGIEDPVAFVGTFGGWFHDAPRFWTLQADAYRVYDPDGSQIMFAVGSPSYGYGDRLVVPTGASEAIVEIPDPDTPLAIINDPQFDGAALMAGDVVLGQVVLVDLSEAVIAPVAVTPACCVGVFALDPYGFAWHDGSWIVSGEEGEVFDHDGDSLTPGQVVRMHGAGAGRLAISTALNATHLWDVDTACVVSNLGSFARQSNHAAMAADGSVLVGHEDIPLGGGFSTNEVRVYSLPDGALLGSEAEGVSASSPRSVAVSDAGDLIAATYFAGNQVIDARVRRYPGFVPWLDGEWMMTPAVAPDGSVTIRSDGSGGFGGTYEGAFSYVHDADNLLDLFEGVTFGFVDNETLLVGTYDNLNPGCFDGAGFCDELIAVELTDLSGAVIAAAPIPDPTGFSRVSSTAVFLPDPPAIYDVFTGDVLWSGADGPAAPVGPDHVAHMVGGDVVLTKWQ